MEKNMKDSKPGLYLESLLSDCLTVLNQKKEVSSFEEGYFQNTVDRLKNNNCISEFIHSSILNELLSDRLLTSSMVEYLCFAVDSKDDLEQLLENSEVVCLLLKTLTIKPKLKDHLEKILSSEKYYQSDVDILDYLDDAHQDDRDIQRYLTLLKGLKQYTVEESDKLKELCLKNSNNIDLINSLLVTDLNDAFEFENIYKICLNKTQKRKILFNC